MIYKSCEIATEGTFMEDYPSVVIDDYIICVICSVSISNVDISVLVVFYGTLPI